MLAASITTLSRMQVLPGALPVPSDDMMKQDGKTLRNSGRTPSRTSLQEAI